MKLCTIKMDSISITNSEECLRSRDKSGDLRQEIEQMFKKRFQYKSAKDELPPPAELFCEFYQIESLQQLRERLNGVKSKLNDYVIEDWSAHTRKRDPSGEVPWRLKNETKAEFVTVAWCKFFECLHQFPLVTNSRLNSLHLCEAPGAFIAALNHYLHTTFENEDINWKWLSTTLNPYYEGNTLSKMISDDRFILYTLENWLFHGDFTGNILKRENIEHMQRQCKERLGEVHLITADGSIDCVEMPDCQEEVVAQLHFAEITAALSILSDGGAFVVKMFTLFEATSISKLFLLHCVFEEVHVFKPATSKRGNSEVYIICLNYRKDTKYLPETIEVMKSKVEEEGFLLPLFAKAFIPETFLLQHEVCARLFMNLQIRAIETNIYSFETKIRQNNRRNHQLRTLVSQEYYRRYNVQQIPDAFKILFAQNIEVGNKTFLHRGSYSEREHLKETGVEEQVFKLRRTLNDLEKAMQVPMSVLLKSELKAPGNLSFEFYEGQPFSSLQSSLFAEVQLLQFAQKLEKIYLNDPLLQSQTKCQLDKEIIKMSYNSETVTNYFQTQRQFFSQIIDAILKAEPQCVCFYNFAFLTHFSVSVLKFLSENIFRELLITSRPQLSIKLSKPIYSEHSSHQLKSLYSAMESNSRLLCILNIAQLHRNEFANALKEHNNLLLIQIFKNILHL